MAAANHPDVRALLDEWGEVWGLQGLADIVSVIFSHRLKRSLGHCRPSTGRITVADQLKSEHPVQFTEVLCHEAAHVAAYHLFGGKAKPHGPEWQALVRKAGFSPRVRAASSTHGGHATARPSPLAVARATRYEHRCPVCQMVRRARRPVPSWVCTECTEAGLPGGLVISRSEAPKAATSTDA